MALLNQLFDLTQQNQWKAILLVHLTIVRLDREAEEIADNYHYPIVNVGKEVCTELFDLTHAEQIRRIQNTFQDICRQKGQGPIILRNISILFEPVFHIDPFRLILSTANLSRMVVMWSGTYSGNQLTYAVPEHHHYRTWTVSNPEIQIHKLS